MGMEEIISKHLDFSRSINYFLDHIQGGKYFDKLLLEHVTFQNGRFFVFLPKGAKLKNLYQFSLGGINPAYSTKEVCYTSAGKKFIPQVRVTTFMETSRFIKTFLDDGVNHFAFFEDAIQSRTDPHIAMPNVEVHFYNDEVYYSLSAKNTIEEIDCTLNRTDCTWHSLVVLGKWDPLPSQLAKQDFLSICSNLNYIITSVHDGENCLFWEKVDENS